MLRAHEQVPPDLVEYDAPCQLWRHIKRPKDGLLHGEGKLPRLPASTPEVSHECEQSASDARATSGGSADIARTGRVYLPALKHLGNRGWSVSHDGISGTSLPVDTRPEGGSLDVYALKEASLPSSCPQSQLDVHELFPRLLTISAKWVSSASLPRHGVYRLSIRAGTGSCLCTKC